MTSLQLVKVYLAALLRWSVVDKVHSSCAVECLFSAPVVLSLLCFETTPVINVINSTVASGWWNISRQHPIKRLLTEVFADRNGLRG